MSILETSLALLIACLLITSPLILIDKSITAQGRAKWRRNASLGAIDLTPDTIETTCALLPSWYGGAHLRCAHPLISEVIFE